jgi:hypothetical protein
MIDSMKGIGKITFILLLLLSSTGLYSQFDTEEFDSLENQILYNKQRAFGVVAHNLGLGMNYRFGKRITYFKSRVWEIEFVSMRSYKQIKLINPYFANSRRYVEGKLNDLFFLRGGILWKKLLNRKPYWGGVELRFIYGGGFSLGLAKPYYYYVIYFRENPGGGWIPEIRTERYDENSPKDDVYGRAPFTKGLNEISLHPGLFGKAGLNFEFGKRNTRITAVEVGGIMDVIPDGVGIMANAPNQILYPSIYLSFSFGKRYNKY